MQPYQTKNGSPGIFLNPFTICSLYKRKFVICPFADEETNRSYPFANRLNGLNRPSHLRLYHYCIAVPLCYIMALQHSNVTLLLLL